MGTRPRLSHPRRRPHGALRHAPEQFELAFGPLPCHLLFVPQPPHLFQLRLEVAHRLVHQQLLERPLLDVARLVLLQVVDVLHRALQDCALGLFARAVGHDASELVDARVDIASPSAFDLFLLFRKKKKNKVRQPITGSRVQRLAYMVVLSLARPLVCAHRGVSAPARAPTRPSPTRPLRLVAFVAVVLVIRHVLWRRTGWWNVGSLGSDARC